jgi:hypothetical protein
MALIDGILQELEQEAETTRLVLERVPEDRLAWRPHLIARTLGELALHVAMVPGGVAELAASESPAQVPEFTDRSPKNASELVPAFGDPRSPPRGRPERSRFCQCVVSGPPSSSSSA